MQIEFECGARIGSKQQPIYGRKTVDAMCIAGLGICKEGVVHIASGLKINMLVGVTKAKTIENVKFITSLGFDWTRNEAEIVQDLRNSPGMMQTLNIIYAKTLDDRNDMT